MYNIRKRLIVLVSLTSLFFVVGCGSSSSTTSTTQEVFFSDYGISIHNNFLPLNPGNLIDRRLRGSIVAAYSMPTSQQNVFEKNIIIIEDTLGTIDLQTYVDQAIGGIQKTWGGYHQLSLTTSEVTCNDTKLPALQHNFDMVRGGLDGTGQQIYFVQYFFAKDKKIFILSSSTDHKDDIDALEKYNQSIYCLTGSTITTS